MLFSQAIAPTLTATNPTHVTWPTYIKWVLSLPGMTQNGLAEQIGVDRHTIWRWKTGKDLDSVTIAYIRAVAKAAGDDVLNTAAAALEVDTQPVDPDPGGEDADSDRLPPLSALLHAIETSDASRDDKVKAAAAAINLYRHGGGGGT